MGGLSKLVRGLDPRWGWIALLVVYGLVYARALGHGFVWDDHFSVVEAAHFEAPLARGLRSTQHDFLDRSILHDVHLSVPYESYRPLLFLSYSVDDALFGRSAVAMHAHNLLLGMACALLAGWVCSLVLGSSRLGLWAAALFALHPLQTEAACYVSARGDLLCACLALLASGAFLSSVRADETRRRFGLALAASLAFALSLTAKESSIGLPLALAVWAGVLGRLRQSRPALLGMVAAAGVYAGVRIALVGAELSRVDRGNALAAIESLPALGLQYLRIFLLPNDLSIERLAAHGASVLLLGWLLLAGLAVLGALALRDRLGSWSRSTRTAWAGAVWFYLLLAPAALASESMGVAADRYAVLPILGACVALVALAVQARGSMRGRWVLPAVAAWGVLLLTITGAQVSVWRSDETLYRNSLLVEPESSMAHYRVGVLRARAQDWGRALGFFERAVELDDQNLRALNNAGVAYLNLGRLDRAEGVLQRTLRLSGEKNFRAWNNLAMLRFAQRRAEHGCAALQRSLSINSEYGVALDNYAKNCSETGSPARAVEPS
jgi:tetratricopeptide (TPR) repeat protein